MNDEVFFKELPDPESARRFLDEFAARHASQFTKLKKNGGLMSDVLTIASFSPLLSTTVLQHPEHIWWLNRKRIDSVVRNKEEMLESLARFSLTNSQVDTHDLLSRFRRRELMRIFLRDIRRLVTVAEITEEISNLADSILEHALRVARQELDNRYGSPLETDEKGRQKPAEFCIVSLGKLGSKELNYSSDIDLLFLYSNEGTTSGVGNRGSLSNREYFIKLAETIVRIVGQQSGEGSAYRVDLRLRPHGRVGPLAMSVADTVRYYRENAKAWERQVLIRSRSSAGEERLFKSFCVQTEAIVFSVDETVENALRNVRESKQKIDLEQINTRGIDVKLGAGGIREIEFVAQALQLAYGGKDEWLRSPHTLISLSRLADRKLVSEPELTMLVDAYTFLRQLEHILQMENGLQTHLIPNDPARRESVAKKMRFATLKQFDRAVTAHTAKVHQVFLRVFGDATKSESIPTHDIDSQQAFHDDSEDLSPNIDANGGENGSNADVIRQFARTSVRLSDLISAKPHLVDEFEGFAEEFPAHDYTERLLAAVGEQRDFASELSAIRHEWARCIFEIIVYDMAGRITLRESKTLQTSLAEGSIAAAMAITAGELQRRTHYSVDSLPLAVLGLGKIGGAGVDYDSDLDLVMVYDDAPDAALPEGFTALELYSKAVEIFTNTLSAITRDGSLYRVDLRLRPFGKDGSSVISAAAFANYMQSKAAIWEMLAFVKLRGVGGDVMLAERVESEIRRIIHDRASAVDRTELAEETRRVRLNLEKQKTEIRHSRDIDIKFGPGGMLDIYFAIRFLQLRHRVPDTADCRSTDNTLAKLRDAGSIGGEDFSALDAGYAFLSVLDHNIRLTVGRSTRLPMANRTVLENIAARMQFPTVEDFLAVLNSHRIAVRAAFERIVV